MQRYGSASAHVSATQDRPYDVHMFAVVFLWIVTTAVSLLLLYMVVRAAVRDGVRQALRPDLLRAVDLSVEGPRPPRGPRAFREAQERQ